MAQKRSKSEISLDAVAYIPEMLMSWQKLAFLLAQEEGYNEENESMLTDLYVNLMHLKNIYEEENEGSMNEQS